MLEAVRIVSDAGKKTVLVRRSVPPQLSLSLRPSLSLSLSLPPSGHSSGTQTLCVTGQGAGVRGVSSGTRMDGRMGGRKQGQGKIG